MDVTLSHNFLPLSIWSLACIEECLSIITVVETFLQIRLRYLQYAAIFTDSCGKQLLIFETFTFSSKLEQT